MLDGDRAGCWNFIESAEAPRELESEKRYRDRLVRVKQILADTSSMRLAGTIIRFTTSPLHVPFRWMLEKNPPPDGSDICNRTIDR